MTPMEMRISPTDLEIITKFNENVVALFDSGRLGDKCPQYWAKIINRCVLPRRHDGEHVFGFPESQLAELFDELTVLRERNRRP